MSRLQQIGSYLSYWLNVVDEHSIHSPFFFDFYQRVIKGITESGHFDEIEKLRSSLLANQTILNAGGFGAGSRQTDARKRTLADITKVSVSTQKLSELYYRIIKNCDAKYIIELGTSVGINTLYLAAKDDARVFTFEGNKAVADVALTNFEFFDKRNIIQVNGNIDQTLPDFLQGTSKLNFVLIDANHTYEGTTKYFQLLLRRLNESSVVVVDDIHWSVGMEKAWNEIRKSELVYGSIDLFRCGILFFDPSLNHQHFILSM